MKDKNKSKTWPNTKKSVPDNHGIPEWQIELVKKELQNIADGNTELIEWNEAKKLFSL